MDNFRKLYLEYCKTYNAEVQECVRNELKRLNLVNDETSLTFNLSTNHLTDKTCMILSKLLANDQNFKCLMLNDCSLSNEGLRDILHALMTNTSIRVLELKGNNIHGNGTEYLAKVLRHNSTLKSLSLEWNSIGLMDTNGFPLFCESIGMNKTLKDLDLRNNQITHTSALELCAAIEINTSLENLDLRWNIIGLVGGKGLLASLKKNHTIVNLQIAGNNIPEDIANSIGLKMGHNSEQTKTVKEFNNRTTALSNELQSIQYHKEKQVNLLLNKIDLQEEAVRKTNRSMSEKMKKLQFALEDRMATMSSMTSKLSIAEADLALAEQKCSDLDHSLQKFRLDKENEIKLLNSKFKREREELQSDKSKVERELNDSNQRYNNLDVKYKELERKCNELQSIAYDAKEKLAQGQAEYQIKMVVLDDESRKLKQRHRDELKDYEANKTRDIDRLKQDFETIEINLKERLNKLEANKHLLEDEIHRLKAASATDKLMYEKDLHELKTKYQMEESLRRKELEDRIKNIQSAKDDLIGENSKMNAKIVDYQQKLAANGLEIETLKRNNDSLRNHLQEKDIELIQIGEKSRTDYDKRVKHLQKEIDRTDEYKEKMQEFELKFKKSEAETAINSKSYQSEIENLKSKVKMLEETIQRYKEEDEIRNVKAQAMIKEYFRPSSVLNSSK